MATSNKNLHLTDDERRIIQRGIESNSSKKSIADTLGKDKSTIGKEIRNHRTLSYKSKYPVECIDAGKCQNKYSHHCSKECPSFKPFICKRRARSPGACNGCERYKRCRFDKYKYEADAAQKEYAEMLCDARAGVNATVNEIRNLGLLIKPLPEQGQSLYVICQNHPEIKVSERTLYTYIEDSVLQDAGVSITNLFFILISKRFKKTSIITTTNLIFSKCADIFDELILTNALLDRLLHHCSVININGPLSRMKDQLQNMEDQE